MNKKEILKLYGINMFDDSEELSRDLTESEVQEFQEATKNLANNFLEIYAENYAENKEDNSI